MLIAFKTERTNTLKMITSTGKTVYVPHRDVAEALTHSQMTLAADYKVLCVNENTTISTTLLMKWLSFAHKQGIRQSLEMVINSDRFDPRNWCISNGLIDQWLAME